MLMSAPEFSYTPDYLRQLASDVLRHARELGATACEADVSEAFGQSVTVRKSEVETIEYNRDKGIGVTVYLGQQRGHASTSDFSPKALRATVAAALSIARFTGTGSLRRPAGREAAGKEGDGSRSPPSVECFCRGGD